MGIPKSHLQDKQKPNKIAMSKNFRTNKLQLQTA